MPIAITNPIDIPDQIEPPNSRRVECVWTKVPEAEWHNTPENTGYDKDNIIQNTGILGEKDFSYSDIENYEGLGCVLFVCSKKVLNEPYYILSCDNKREKPKYIHILTPSQRQELSKNNPYSNQLIRTSPNSITNILSPHGGKRNKKQKIKNKTKTNRKTKTKTNKKIKNKTKTKRK
jgi:hypothetical protein